MLDMIGPFKGPTIVNIPEFNPNSGQFVCEAKQEE